MNKSNGKSDAKKTKLSAFDKIEEMRYHTYETSQQLTQLVSVIEQSSQLIEDNFICVSID
jgi:hypothetical protein